MHKQGQQSAERMNKGQRKGTLMHWLHKRAKTEESTQHSTDMHCAQTCKSEIHKKERTEYVEMSSGDTATEESVEHTKIQSKKDKQSNKDKDADTQEKESSESEEDKEHKYAFVAKPVDKFGHREGDKEYDRSTLHIPAEALAQMTPCEQQFWQIKMEYYDTVVLFKKGKFYELFENDAVLTAQLFGFKLTKRGDMRMTGVPEMSLEYWIRRLIEKGHKVAVIEQKESSVAQNMKTKTGEAKKKVIERELKEVVTEVTNSQEGVGICAVVVHKEEDRSVRVSMAVFRPMESEFCVQTYRDSAEMAKTQSIMKKENIKEVLGYERVQCREKQTKVRQDMWGSKPDAAVDSMGGERMAKDERHALCVLVAYLQYLKYAYTPKLVQSSGQKTQSTMHIDGKTMDTLALVADGKNSILAQIDRTRTKLGQRLLRRWLVQPLCSEEEIETRYNTADVLERCAHTAEIQSMLGKIHDINEIVKKAKSGRIKAEEIRKLVSTLEHVQSMHRVLARVQEEQKTAHTAIQSIAQQMEQHSIHTAITQGFDIRKEIMPLPDNRELVDAEKNRARVVQMIHAYAEKETDTTSVQFVAKRIGREHYLETTNRQHISSKYIASGHTNKVVRYTTGELRKLSETYLEAEERITMLGQESVSRVSARIAAHEETLRTIAHGVAMLDCLVSYAEMRGCRAHVGTKLQIHGLTNVKHTHIPNDVTVEESNKLLVVTGPNMGGKSTFLRNIAVAIVMRQMGMRVPAESFVAPVYDRIFTRIGAGDNLVDGESTFEIEMKETANILQKATAQSFVIIDELGRGTSTREGSAISLAVKEYMKKMQCTVLYSTHFFSAILPADRAVKMNYKYVTAEDGSEQIVYMYKLTEGVCSNSCGIDICKVTKVPQTVIDRAVEIKKRREEKREEKRRHDNKHSILAHDGYGYNQNNRDIYT